MAGIYIHIPFCRKVCFYCDFHFTVSLKNKEAVMEAIKKEAVDRKNYLGNTDIDTVYFGGGTPTVLSSRELNDIFNVLNGSFNIKHDAEITLEANPDDLNPDYLSSLKADTTVNRLSIGVQSFIDKHLIWMNRRHTAKEAVDSILNAKSAGFNNINADLIYGIPRMSAQQWQDNIKTMTDLDVEHISAYHLTIEPETVFGRRHKKGHIKEIDEGSSLEQFELLLRKMKDSGFEHYEISNFAKPGFYSNHNLNYWKLGRYLGLGPSAHSFDGSSRQWNTRVNTKYIDGVNGRGEYFEKEILYPDNIFNEYVMLSLRTKWGTDVEHVKNRMGAEYASHLIDAMGKYISSGHAEKAGNYCVLTDKGKFISDHIIGELFV